MKAYAEKMTLRHKDVDLSGKRLGERIYLSPKHCERVMGLDHNPTTELAFTIHHDKDSGENYIFRNCDLCFTFFKSNYMAEMNERGRLVSAY